MALQLRISTGGLPVNLVLDRFMPLLAIDLQSTSLAYSVRSQFFTILSIISSLNMLLRFSLRSLRRGDEKYQSVGFWAAFRLLICMYPLQVVTKVGSSLTLYSRLEKMGLYLRRCLAQYRRFAWLICSTVRGTLDSVYINIITSRGNSHLILQFYFGMDSFRGAKIMAVTIFLICGTISTFAYKLMGSQWVDEGGVHRKFFHPYMQSFTMFMGECFCLFLYLSNRKKNYLPLEPGKTPHKFYYFLIPALADACSSMLQYMGLNFISGSTYLMFKGASIVTTAIFSKILFNMVIERRHWIGCGAAIVGLVVVGASGLLTSDSSDSGQMNNQFLGYILMLISLIFNGFLYAYEQFLMRKHTINPLQMVGCEGCFGIFIISLVALSFSIIPCDLQPKLCVYDHFGNPYLERIDEFFREVFTDVVLALLVVVGIITISAYNLNGVRITKLFDALTRSLLNITKTGIIWVVGILITISVGDNPDYQLQSRDIVVNVVKGGGFACIVFGTLVYNKLILAKYLADFEEKQPDHDPLISLLKEREEQVQTSST